MENFINEDYNLILMQPRDKLRIWAKSYKRIQSPLDPFKSIPFLEPVLRVGEESVGIEALVTPSMNILVGEGGSGKSTLARQLIYICGEEYDPFTEGGYPIFLRLKREVAGVSTVDELASYLSQDLSDLHISADEFRTILDNPNLFLVLDGLDEIFDVSQRRQFFNFAQSALGSKRVLLTSRPNETVDSQRHYEIVGVSEDEAKRYINRKFRREYPQERDIGDRFWKEIEDSPFMQGLIRNVILLEEAYTIYPSKLRFGSSIYDFMVSLTETLAFDFVSIGDRDQSYGASQELQYGLRILGFDGKMGSFGKPIERALYACAVELGKRRVRSMPFEEYVPIVEKAFYLEKDNLHPDEVKLATRAFLHFSPILCKYEREHYGFIHLSLQDSIGIVAATEHDLVRGYQEYVSDRDTITQRRFFECIVTRKHGAYAVDHMQLLMNGQVISPSNVVPFSEVIVEHNVRIGTQYRDQLNELLHGINTPHALELTRRL